MFMCLPFVLELVVLGYASTSPGSRENEYRQTERDYEIFDYRGHVSYLPRGLSLLPGTSA